MIDRLRGKREGDEGTCFTTLGKQAMAGVLSVGFYAWLTFHRLPPFPQSAVIPLYASGQTELLIASPNPPDSNWD